MKHSKSIIVILALILVASLALSIWAFAKPAKQASFEDNFFVRPDAEKVKPLDLPPESTDEAPAAVQTETPAESAETTPAAEQTEAPEEGVQGADYPFEIMLAPNGTELEYVETVNHGDVTARDYYKDKNGNRYGYDLKGHLLSFTGNSETANLIAAENQKDDGSGMRDGSVTEEQAAAIAAEFAGRMYGDIFKEFKYEKVSYIQTTNLYDVKFRKWYVDDFIYGPFLDVSVLPDGTVSFCDMCMYYECEAVDKSVLNGLDPVKLTEYAKGKIDRREDWHYNMSRDGWEISEGSVTKAELWIKDGKPVLVLIFEGKRKMNDTGEQFDVEFTVNYDLGK